MKTLNQINAPSIGRRGFSMRAAILSLAFATAAIPVIAGDGSAAAKEDANAIRPFHVNVPKAKLTDLRKRINATQWPERETVTDTSQGVQLATMQKLARYWATDYD